MKKRNKILNKNHFRVAIFGSARIKSGHSTYRLVSNLAESLAKEEIDIVTGGGPGLMNAASKGHHLGKGKKILHSIGLTIKLPFESRTGYHLDIRKDFKKFSKRLDAFMEISNIVVVSPGGIGTLLELYYTWQLVQVKHICETPIILLGPMWLDLIKWMKKYQLKKGLVSKGDFKNIFFANNVRQAMKIIKQVHSDSKKQAHVCRNFNKYGRS